MCRNLFAALKCHFSYRPSAYERRADYNNTRKVEPGCDTKKKQHAVESEGRNVHRWVWLPCFGVDFTVQVRIHANRSACCCVLNILSCRRQKQREERRRLSSLLLSSRLRLRLDKYFMNGAGEGSWKWNVWTAATSWRICSCFSTPNNRFLKIAYAGKSRWII